MVGRIGSNGWNYHFAAVASAAPPIENVHPFTTQSLETANKERARPDGQGEPRDEGWARFEGSMEKVEAERPHGRPPCRRRRRRTPTKMARLEIASVSFNSLIAVGGGRLTNLRAKSASERTADLANGTDARCTEREGGTSAKFSRISLRNAITSNYNHVFAE